MEVLLGSSWVRPTDWTKQKRGLVACGGLTNIISREEVLFLFLPPITFALTLIKSWGYKIDLVAREW
ncbi:unnamed protein product [Sphenostylis stenocarpa]|uniref:Uncharacterized protein n=1 Tax=Sphenostylis stenocarpa TaxID=92480 RepID=A0AA86RXV6_9FABA|nr:unnamed protein product [Sphenostylis stenocarpa]